MTDRQWIEFVSTELITVGNEKFYRIYPIDLIDFLKEDYEKIG